MKKGRKVLKIIGIILTVYLLFYAICCGVCFVNHSQLKKELTSNESIQLVNTEALFEFTPEDTFYSGPFYFMMSSEFSYNGVRFYVDSDANLYYGIIPWIESWSQYYLNIVEHLTETQLASNYETYNVNWELPFEEDNEGKNIIAVFEESLVDDIEYKFSCIDFSISKDLTIGVLVTDRDNWDNTKKAAIKMWDAIQENINNIETFNAPLNIEVLTLRAGEKPLGTIKYTSDIKDIYQFNPKLTLELECEIEGVPFDYEESDIADIDATENNVDNNTDINDLSLYYNIYKSGEYCRPCDEYFETCMVTGCLEKAEEQCSNCLKHSENPEFEFLEHGVDSFDPRNDCISFEHGSIPNIVKVTHPFVTYLGERNLEEYTYITAEDEITSYNVKEYRFYLPLDFSIYTEDINGVEYIIGSNYMRNLMRHVTENDDLKSCAFLTGVYLDVDGTVYNYGEEAKIYIETFDNEINMKIDVYTANGVDNVIKFIYNLYTYAFEHVIPVSVKSDAAGVLQPIINLDIDYKGEYKIYTEDADTDISTSIANEGLLYRKLYCMYNKIALAEGYTEEELRVIEAYYDAYEVFEKQMERGVYN